MNNVLLIILAIIIVAAIVIGTVFLVLGVSRSSETNFRVIPGAGWHTVQNTYNHSNRTINKGPIDQPKTVWNTGSAYTFSTTSVVTGDDGTIYAGTSNTGSAQYLVAFNTDGSVKWECVLPQASQIFAAPSIGRYGIIYVMDKRGFVYAVSPLGGASGAASGGPKVLWFQTVVSPFYVFPNGFFGFTASPVIHYSSSGDDDTIFIAANKIYILDSKTGTTLHTYEPNVTSDTTIVSTPAIDPSGNLYFVTQVGFSGLNNGTGGGYLYSIDLNGIENFVYEFDNANNDNVANLTYSPEYQYVIISDVSGMVYAVNVIGTPSVVWSFATHSNDAYPGPGLGVILGFGLSQDGETVYAATSNIDDSGSLFAIPANSTGAATGVWSYNTSRQVFGAPVVDSEGIIYLNDNAYIYAFEPTGTLLWETFPLVGATLQTSLILGDKSIIINNSEGSIYAMI
jgi:hypothetical protein